MVTFQTKGTKRKHARTVPHRTLQSIMHYTSTSKSASRAARLVCHTSSACRTRCNNVRLSIPMAHEQMFDPTGTFRLRCLTLDYWDSTSVIEHEHISYFGHVADRSQRQSKPVLPYETSTPRHSACIQPRDGSSPARAGHVCLRIHHEKCAE